MITLYWIWRNGLRRRTYKFTRADAMVGLSVSAGF